MFAFPREEPPTSGSELRAGLSRDETTSTTKLCEEYDGGGRTESFIYVNFFLFLMKVKDVRLEDVCKILELYKECGGCVPYHVSPQLILEDLKKAIEDDMTRFIIEDGYRIGSKWTGHSKLAFKIGYDQSIQPIFKTNLDRSIPYEKKLEPIAEASAKQFSKKVTEYLNQKSSASE